MRNIVHRVMNIPKRASVHLVRAYRKYLSPDTGLPRRLGITKGSTCGFYPTCSAYTEEAIEKYGFFKGWGLALRRIGRCHPWSEPQIDKVP